VNAHNNSNTIPNKIITNEMKINTKGKWGDMQFRCRKIRATKAKRKPKEKPNKGKAIIKCY